MYADGVCVKKSMHVYREGEVKLCSIFAYMSIVGIRFCFWTFYFFACNLIYTGLSHTQRGEHLQKQDKLEMEVKSGQEENDGSEEEKTLIFTLMQMPNDVSKHTQAYISAKKLLEADVF